MSNLNEILENVDKIKVSIVMQVNLQDYSGSRRDPINKFHRAVRSFKDQIYKNCELIIVSDGCNKAHQIYNRSYREDENIKFVYYDRHNVPKMYDQVGEEGGKYFRGFARNIGIGCATGNVITYMDSDDFLMPEFSMTCMLIYNTDKSKDWWINTSWYDHANVDNSNQNIQAVVDPKTIEAIPIEGLPDLWKPMRLHENRIIMSPWLFMHSNKVTVSWRDVISSSVSEDVDFHNRVRAEFPNGVSYSNPIYVRCHFAEHWDV